MVVEFDIKESVEWSFSDVYKWRINDYCEVFFVAREEMENRKNNGQELTLDDLNGIFAVFNSTKQSLIEFYSSLKPEQAREYFAYLWEIFLQSSWPKKRCVWEVIAWINNFILKSYKS